MFLTVFLLWPQVPGYWVTAVSRFCSVLSTSSCVEPAGFSLQSRYCCHPLSLSLGLFNTKFLSCCMWRTTLVFDSLLIRLNMSKPGKQPHLSHVFSALRTDNCYIARILLFGFLLKTGAHPCKATSAAYVMRCTGTLAFVLPIMAWWWGSWFWFSEASDWVVAKTPDQSHISPNYLSGALA